MTLFVALYLTSEVYLELCQIYKNWILAVNCLFKTLVQSLISNVDISHVTLSPHLHVIFRMLTFRMLIFLMLPCHLKSETLKTWNFKSCTSSFCCLSLPPLNLTSLMLTFPIRKNARKFSPFKEFVHCLVLCTKYYGVTPVSN